MSELIPKSIVDELGSAAAAAELDISGGRIRRTSSRFCLGVEHGDYNGTDLFGVGTDRFIWLAWKPNRLGTVRLFSANFPKDGVICVEPTAIPSADMVANNWARFPFGVASALSSEGVDLQQGFDAVVFGNIPGGGMSRSASLTLNLILTFLEANGRPVVRESQSTADGMKIVDLAQSVENHYIGSPCGNLDQIMIYFARAGMGTHYSPRERAIEHLALGSPASDFRLVSLDTGTDRPGLEKSTYRVRREECEQLVRLAEDAFDIECLADVKSSELYEAMVDAFGKKYPNLCKRLKYVFEAQQRFGQMLDAWKNGNVKTLGDVFRLDGFGLRDDYEISGPELESMCDIARTVDGVLGERMLRGGDKGASGAIVLADSVESLEAIVSSEYPKRHPEYANDFAVHACGIVDGITEIEVAL